MKLVHAMAVAVVLLAMAVQSAEVQMLDEVGVPASPSKAVDAEKLRAKIFEGDDTDLLQESAGAVKPKLGKPKKKGGGKKGKKGKKGGMDKPPQQDPKSSAPPAAGSGSQPPGAGPLPKKGGPKLPKLPKLSKLDEKYMPAIMDKLTKMRGEMSKIKGANWMEILEEHRDGVVQIMVVKKKFMWKAAYRAPLSEEISGSGWFIDNKEFTVDTKDDMLVVTNAHVAKNAAEINILVPSLGQEPIPAEVVGLCSQRDIALLKVTDPKKLLALYKAKTGKAKIVKQKLGDSDEMKRGARCMAVGYPLGLKSVKASMGIVSGYQQFKSALYLQTTAPINPGNSGGPLFNQKGQVVGINSAKIAQASGMSFAIASVQLKVMLDVLYKRRQFVVPFLGYSFSVGTKLIQQYLKVKGDTDKTGGIYITKVQPRGLFKKAGVKPGDLLLTVDGANIDRFGQTWMPTIKDNINILGLLARKRIGSKITLGVWRKASSELLSLQTTYDETPPFAIPFIYEPLLQKPKYHIFAGVVFMELSVNLVTVMLQSNVAELIRYMKPKNRLSPAVIVAGVLPGSIANLDGSIKPGLIVQEINGKKVNSMD